MQRSKSESFSGLGKSQRHNMSYGSTSHYLRQRVGTEKFPTPRDRPHSARPAPGTPAYKSKEEYYDEVLALKKQIAAQEVHHATQKSKVRRLEEDNIKKEKQIEQLLDPGKNEEIRRSLSEKRSDTSTVANSLKQKILKLEQQLKDKEASFNKLQSDLKTTKYEELKAQTEMFYREIVRLNQLKTVPNDTRLSKTAPVGGIKETPNRLRALQDTIKRMNEQNTRLTSENKTLKEDLDKMLQDKASGDTKRKDYEEMNKRELLNSIAKLEKRLDRSEADALSIVSDVDGRRGDVEGKIVLEGTVPQRLDQLDKRETELLEEQGKQRGIIKRLKEDRAHYRKKCDEKDKEIKTLKKDIEDLHGELDGFYDKDRVSPRRTPREPSPRARPPSPKAKPRSRASSVASSDQIRKVERFRENHAAKKIQRGWRSHQDDDEAAELIQGAFRGHKTRQANLTRMRGYMAESDNISMNTVTATESELEDAADMIQSSVRGHKFRKSQIQKGGFSRRLDSEGEEEDEEDELLSSSRRMSGRLTPQMKRPSSAHQTPPQQRRTSSTGRRTPPLSKGRQTPPLFGRSTPPVSRKTPPTRRTPTPKYVDSDDDSDDDIVVAPTRKGRLF